ncbi:Calpain-9 [Phytophthora citrophthora]|uniref:Calpain-9 n=1 Tax=Phytophthora citrophthora TaxID=4793 RepID=A0AAD9LMV0_9STRA|nr:Calpain-9 [Phytophthora citrophthora]
MFCGECGHRWEPDEIASARFCAECGAPREDVPPAAAPTPTPAPAAPAPASSFSGSSSSSFSSSSYVAPASTATSSSSSFSSTPSYNSAAPSTTSYSTPSTASYSTPAAASYSAPSTTSYSTPAATSYSTPVTTVAPSSDAKCTQCGEPFGDSTALFCGECGAHRPAATTPAPAAAAPSPTVANDDGGDLFGVASTSYSAPSSTSATTSQPSGYSAGSSFESSASVSYNPPYAAASTPAAPTPAAAPTYDPYAPPASSPTYDPYAPPQTPAAPVEPPASVNLEAAAPSGSSISSLLANLSVSKPEGERDEPDGKGVGVSIRQVVRARNMDSLSTKLEISNAVERNRTDPQERSEGYNVTKVNDTITVVQNERADPVEERYYNQRTLPDNGEWLQILRKNRQAGSKFTDPQFPPDASSIFRDATNPKYPHLQEYIWKWKRVTDFFNETAYVEITMLDDDKKLVCSMSIKNPAEAESILEVIRQNPTPVDGQFLKIAKDAVTTGVTKRKRDHLLLLTKNMIVHMSEFVQDGLQRFELMWEKSLLDHYKPLAFASVGEGSGYRVDGSESGVVSRVSVLVPVYFHAQGTCLFDRSRESKAASRISGVGISPGDMRVGRLADAYVFGALSILSTSQLALSQTFPELSDDLVRPDRVEVGTAFPKEQQYNEEGVYAVRFWRNNRSRVVVIDDYIPCSQYGKPVFGSFTGSNDKFEIWSLLVEKAYAKLHGGYEAIVGGQEGYALQDLYGGVPARYKLQEKCPNEEVAWQAISTALQSGSLLGCSNEDMAAELPTGLRKTDAYGIMKLVELDYQGEHTRLIQLRNSWGIGTHGQPEKWKGSWSNDDPRWHNFSRMQKVECGFQFREDFTYWMDFSAFYCFFTTVIESRNLYNFRSLPDGLGNPVSPSLSVHIVSGEWNGITSGGRDAMHLNPQVQLFSPATNGCNLVVHLEQPSRRVKLETEYTSYIAPVVVKNGERQQRKIDLSQDVVATGTFISNRSCVLEVPLMPAEGGKPFVIIPATYDGHLPYQLGFSMTLFTSKPTAVVPVSDTGSLPVCCICQKALSGTFRTFTHEQDGQRKVDRVCQGACVDAYRERNTPVCVDCHQRIEVVEGRFSGRMFTLPDGSSVHAECIDAYQIRTSEKCIHCGHAIAAIPGRFDGKYFQVNGGKCHGECMEAYQLATAQRCVHCSEPVIKLAGKFDGRFYKIEGDRLVHFECWEQYQQSVAPKCVHCAQPILQIPGRFDGRFYELASGIGKVHFECWNAYQTLANAPK